MLPEDEAILLAIVFEETGAYQYKKNKELESGHSSRGSGEGTKPGLQPGFEEEFSFGEEDETDYWHFKDDGVQIVD
jgi:hypothetical protein